MKTPGHNWLARCVALIMSCSLPSPTWKLSWDNCGPTVTHWKSLVESTGLATDSWEMEPRSYGSLRRTIRQTRKKRFSAAIDYQGLWKSAALPFFGGVPRRIGFSSQAIREFGVPILYTDRVRCTHTHISEQNGKLSQRAGARNGVGPVTISVPSLQEAFVLQLLRGFSID